MSYRHGHGGHNTRLSGLASREMKVLNKTSVGQNDANAFPSAALYAQNIAVEWQYARFNNEKTANESARWDTSSSQATLVR